MEQFQKSKRLFGMTIYKTNPDGLFAKALSETKLWKFEKDDPQWNF